jgi:hypothetical protein
MFVTRLFEVCLDCAEHWPSRERKSPRSSGRATSETRLDEVQRKIVELVTAAGSIPVYIGADTSTIDGSSVEVLARYANISTVESAREALDILLIEHRLQLQPVTAEKWIEFSQLGIPRQAVCELRASEA